MNDAPARQSEQTHRPGRRPARRLVRKFRIARRAVAFLPIFAVTISISALLYVVLSVIRGERFKPFVRILRARVWTCGTSAGLFALGIRVHPVWHEESANKAPNGVDILIGNHCTFFDAFIVQMFFRIILLSKAEDGNPVFDLVLKISDTICVKRSEATSRAKAILLMDSMLAKGISVSWFPEGTTLSLPGPHRYLWKAGGFRTASPIRKKSAAAANQPVRQFVAYGIFFSGEDLEEGKSLSWGEESLAEHLTTFVSARRTHVFLRMKRYHPYRGDDMNKGEVESLARFFYAETLALAKEGEHASQRKVPS